MPNTFLIIGAALSAIAALLHVAIIIQGPSWYRFFGAGEKLATLAEQGSRVPALVTSAIALVLFTWSAYALSGAGLISALPLLKWSLIAITVIYLIRGIAGFWLVVFPSTEHSVAFAFWSSLTCLIFGLFHLLGLMQVWPEL